MSYFFEHLHVTLQLFLMVHLKTAEGESIYLHCQMHLFRYRGVIKFYMLDVLVN